MTTKTLGKLPKKTDRRTLQFARYLPALPAPLAFVDHASKLPVKIGNMGNDQYGDCTFAAAGHMIQSWSVYADYPMLTIPDKDILTGYFALSPNDQGCWMLDVLNYWRKTGIGGDKIEAFVETAVASIPQAALAIEYFGSVYIGMSLPNTNTFGPWNVKSPTWPANPQNGHAVCLLGYDADKEIFKVATWGEIWDMSFDWFKKYCDESYAVLNDLSLNASGKTPEGFALNELMIDLQHLGDPIVDPVPVPPAPSPPVPVARAPIVITGSERWVVVVDGIEQSPQHVSALEAVQHADKLRWRLTGASPHGAITILHRATYSVV